LLALEILFDKNSFMKLSRPAKKSMFMFCLIFGFVWTLQAQLKINEVASTNPGYLLDEDGDSPDWFELLNANTITISLDGMKVTDGGNTWTFPNLTLNGGERIVVFASGKDRSTIIKNGDHWETATKEDDLWQFDDGTNPPPADWTTSSIIAGWPFGTGGFGYGDNDDNTQLASGTITAYYRRTFEVSDVSAIIAGELSMDYDDGFVAYLNGVEIARAGVPDGQTNTTLANIEHEAEFYNGGNPTDFLLDPAFLASLLVQGENVLAVEIHNISAGSSDLSGRTWLHFGINNSNIYFEPTPNWFFPSSGFQADLHTNFKLSGGETIMLFNADATLADIIAIPELERGDVYSRLPDGQNWCYSNEPTPNNINLGTCYSGYSDLPVYVSTPGFYDNPLALSVVGEELYVTNDGREPKIPGDLYVGGMMLNQTIGIRAINVNSGRLPSRTANATFFIKEPSNLPIVSITSDPINLFNGPGPAIYDNSITNTSVPVNVEYFDQNKVRRFSENAGLSIVGNFSTAFAQKSMQFIFDNDFGASGDIPNAVFQDDKPDIKFLKGFRVRNMDDDYSQARMRDVVANRLSKGTNSSWAAYQNVAVFINGKYWGHYGARELLDRYYVRDNYGADPNNVDMVKTLFGNPLEMEEGTDSSYLALTDFIINSNMSSPQNYAKVDETIDVNNWIDYFCNQIYVDNEDWFPSFYYNNTRMFTARDPYVKWKYLQWDQGYSQYNPSFNLLENVLNDPNNSTHSQMFKSLLSNINFQRLFINRFADLLNTNFRSAKVHKLIGENALELKDEITRTYERWIGPSGGNYPPPDSTEWVQQVENLKNFHAFRRPEQFNHIQSEFNLNDQVDITLNVIPAGAGFIKISTIIPQDLPWTGTYFNGVPVSVRAVANPGFKFTKWTPNQFISNGGKVDFTTNITQNTSFTAEFSGSSILDGIVVSELNYNSDSTLSTGDWIELHNNSSSELDVSGYTLRDANPLNSFVLPDPTKIPAGGYLVLAADIDKFQAVQPSIANVIGFTGFDFSNSGDSIVLLDAIGNDVSHFKYDDKDPWPLAADGYGRSMERFDTWDDPAQSNSWFDGCVGGSPGKAYSPCQEQLIVTEVNYRSSIDSDAGDWLEIYNTTNASISLNGWGLRDNSDANYYAFPTGVSIASGAYLVVFQDGAKFNTRHPNISNAVGSSSIGLGSAGDAIRLYGPNGVVNYAMVFLNKLPWPLEADGEGKTLEILDYNGNASDGSNWFAGCPEGSPGVVYNPDCTNSTDEVNTMSDLFYPNPAINWIILKSDKISKVSLTDLLGRTIILKPNGLGMIDVSHLPVGYYTVLFETDKGERIVQKMVKQ